MNVKKLYECLLEKYGPQGWWPLQGRYHQKIRSDRDRLEICIGAILTQNTGWKNAAAAIEKISMAGLMDVGKLHEIPGVKLQSVIRSSGYYRQKAKKIKCFVAHVRKRGLKRFFSQDVPELRKELLSLWGIGPETADSIILYAAQKPVFVVDEYTRRVLLRYGMIPPGVSYDDIQSLFHKKLPADAKLFNEYHALLVEHAKRMR